MTGTQYEEDGILSFRAFFDYFNLLQTRAMATNVAQEAIQCHLQVNKSTFDQQSTLSSSPTTKLLDTTIEPGQTQRTDNIVTKVTMTALESQTK